MGKEHGDGTYQHLLANDEAPCHRNFVFLDFSLFYAVA
jgi:hypothetical protein